MLIKACFECKFHKIKQDEGMQTSYCRKESCWARYSKCIELKAVERFLNEERILTHHSQTVTNSQ